MLMPCCEKSKLSRQAVDKYRERDLVTWKLSLLVILTQVPDMGVKNSSEDSSPRLIVGIKE